MAICSATAAVDILSPLFHYTVVEVGENGSYSINLVVNIIKLYNYRIYMYLCNMRSNHQETL